MKHRQSPTINDQEHAAADWPQHLSSYAIQVNERQEKRELASLIVFVTLLPLLLFSGCDRVSAWRNPSASQSPLDAMNEEVRRGRWIEAWQYVELVATEYPDDPKVLAKLARVAHESQHPNDAARLLIAACRAESFADEKRNEQAVVATTAAGKLYNGMEFLSEVVEAQPNQLESRRLLFDLLIGTENRPRAIPHGRFLIQKRRFDLELLTSLSNTELRTLDSSPLSEMIARNPSDKRPLIGDAKAAFDKGLFAEAISALRQILISHPADLPAQVLLGKSLVASGQFQELEAWADALQGDYESHAGYWLTIGDWARHRKQYTQAVRAYWESARRDSDVLEAWVRLQGVFNQNESALPKLSNDVVQGIEQRIDQLSRFHQVKNRFVRTGSISRAISVEIVSTLTELGRLWEAEAWAAIALTFPEDPATDVPAARQAIVAKLNQNVPWQIMEGHPELQIDLSTVELPSLVRKTKTGGEPIQSVAVAETPPPVVTTYSLHNEANERGLRFFGRTGDNVVGPGVPFFQTLGCGGGALDYDLDGWTDLYLVSAGGTPPNQDSASNSLMRNLAGQFDDVTALSTTDDTGFGQGVAVGDINEDGFADFYILNYGRNRLLINQGDGTFQDGTNRWVRNQRSQWSSSGAIADIDLDGLSDLIVVNYCAGLEPVTKVCDDVNAAPGTVPRACSPLAFSAEPDEFFKGGPTGELIDLTAAWGAIPSVLGRGLGITVGSFDGTPGIDIFVANDMTNNHYWSRDSGELFRLVESAIPRGLAGDARSLAQGSMGIATADIDRDGDIDFYVTNFMREYNTYHVQQSSGIWQDQTTQAGLSIPTLPLVGFGTQAVDVDNDGTLELVVSNGHVDSYEDLSAESSYAQPIQVFRQSKQNQFESVGEVITGEYFASKHVGRGLWVLDANRDGKMDMAITHQTEPVALLINHTPSVHHFIELQLVGQSCSRNAIGATVNITAGDLNWFATATAGDGYMCSNERVLHFGLGNVPSNLAVTVRWPDGTFETIDGLGPDTRWLLVQGMPAYDLKKTPY